MFIINILIKFQLTFQETRHAYLRKRKSNKKQTINENETHRMVYKLCKEHQRMNEQLVNHVEKKSQSIYQDF